MVTFCNLEQIQILVSAMEKCYDAVEVAYGHNKAAGLG